MLSIVKMVKRNIHSQSAYLDWLVRDLKDCETILELGCGSYSPILKIGLGQRTSTVDIFKPYINKHVKARDYKSCQQADILTMSFTPKSFDAVVMFDVLEHLARPEVEACKLFDRMEKAAIKKVIFFTPNGFVENDEVDGDIWQRHLSAWEPEDYRKRGYTVRGATGWRKILGKASLPKYKPTRLFEGVALLSQPLIYDHPEWAWHSYAVKKVG